MSLAMSYFLAWLLTFVTFIGIPAFYVGWKRPKVVPVMAKYVVLTSVIVFSVFMAFWPPIQRDWFTWISGVVIVGGLLGFFGFAVVVRLAELLRIRYPKGENYPALNAQSRKYQIF